MNQQIIRLSLLRHYTRFIFLLGLIIWASQGLLLGQIRVDYRCSDGIKHLLTPLRTTVGDTTEIISIRDSVLVELQRKGYFDSQVHLDSPVVDHFILNINPGPRYKWNLPSKRTVKAGALSGRMQGYFDEAGWEQQLEGQLEQLVEDGYPFAQIRLTSARLRDSSISGMLQIKRGRHYYIKGIKMNGTAKLSNNFMMRYLRINGHKPYSHAVVAALSRRIDALPFVKQQGVPIVRFYKEFAQIVVHLDPKPSNSFDVLLGIAQAKDQTARRFNLTGHANLAFQNLFGQAEKMALDYRGLPGTQSLDVLGELPYVLQTSLGSGARFKLYYKTDAYTETNGEVHLSVDVSDNSKVYAFGSRKTARLISIDTNYIKTNKALPSDLDYDQTSFGLKWNYNRLDFAPNPLSGWRIRTSGAIGKNVALPRASLGTLTEVNVDSLLSARNKQSTRWIGGVDITYFLKLSGRMTLRTSLKGQGIWSVLLPSDNELFRIGGGRSIRGFDEEQFRAQKFLYGTLEYRFLTSKNGYLSAFADYGYVENTRKQQLNILHPLGIGLGFVFETKNGIFQLQYAVGKTANTTFDFTNGQVHLGYLSLF